MDVHNGLGPGWDEWDYHRAMIEALCARGHETVSHARKSLVHRGAVVDHFELDLLVDNLIILELKHIKSDFHPEHIAQTINYLKRWAKRLGVLVNFGAERLFYRRIPYDSVSGRIQHTGKWYELNSRIPLCCRRVEEALEGVLQQHGYGYSVSVFKKLMMSEFEHQETVAIHPLISPVFWALKLEDRELDSILVDSALLVSFSATGRDASSLDLAYMKSYMKQLGISFGILIDIGNAEIQMKGIL